jgi:glycosyltransferase involved in cell wall biosynthesis
MVCSPRPVRTTPEEMPAPEPGLSVVIPVFDEAENLRPLWESLRPVLEATGESYEVLFVDDGSTDGSGRILDELAAAEPRVRVLHLDRNWGQSAAFDAGFRASRGRWVVTMDADLQNDPADIPRLLERRPVADVVCGIRTRRRDPWMRRVSSRIANAFRNLVTGDRITDVGCSLRVYRGDLVRRIHLYRGFHRFLPTLLRMEGARVVEVPVSHRPRHAGRSKYGIHNRLWRGLVDCFGIRWLRWRRQPYRVVGQRGREGRQP